MSNLDPQIAAALIDSATLLIIAFGGIWIYKQQRKQDLKLKRKLRQDEIKFKRSQEKNKC